MAFRLKQILYQTPDPSYLDETLQLCGRVSGWEADLTGDPPTLSWSDLRVRFARAKTPAETLGLLKHGYFNLLILDLRVRTGDMETLYARFDQVRAFFEQVQAIDVEERYGTHRMIALVSGPDDDLVDQLIATLGRHGVGRILRDPLDETKRGAYIERLVGEVRKLMLERIPGKSSLCLAGGAITGLFFEMGALKCLEDALPQRGLNHLDMYFGISAGSVLAGVLANGYTIGEMMASVAGREGGRIAPIDLKLLRLANLNVRDMSRRILGAMRDASMGLGRMMMGRAPLGLASVLGTYPDWIGPPLRAERFERRMREMFSEPGATNDFRQLRSRLYVTATDQDRRVEVVFGDKHQEHVPISKAIEASLSLNPAFESTEIDGRYYTDGAVTRTSNFVEAIEKRADLIIVIDPFLPYVSREAGFVRKRGLLYNIDQDVRTMSYTRFEKSRNAVLPQNPHVSMYTFLPANKTRRLLAENPMDHRPFLAIWKAAYQSTLRRLEVVEHRLAGDLLPRGLPLDLSRPRAVSDRLSSVENPAYEDFFADGRPQVQPATAPNASQAARPPLRTVG